MQKRTMEMVPQPHSQRKHIPPHSPHPKRSTFPSLPNNYQRYPEFIAHRQDSKLQHRRQKMAATNCLAATTGPKNTGSVSRHRNSAKEETKKKLLLSTIDEIHPRRSSLMIDELFLHLSHFCVFEKNFRRTSVK